MQTATKNLESDHEQILRLIAVMEKMVQTNSTNTDHFEKVVNLIRNYADGFHHAKEEHLLFPELEKKGFSTEQGPVAVMLYEHVQGRNYVQGMADAIAGVKQGKTEALQEVYENMLGYGELLRNHISKENTVLFRMADRVLSETDQQDLLKAFAKVEKNSICGGAVQDCIAAIDALEVAYPTKESQLHN